VTHLPTAWLDGKHVVFGGDQGMDVVDALKAGDTLVRVEVIRKRIIRTRRREEEAEARG